MMSRALLALALLAAACAGAAGESSLDSARRSTERSADDVRARIEKMRADREREFGNRVPLGGDRGASCVRLLE